MAESTLTQLLQGSLTGAKELSLAGCQLTEFPKEIYSLANTLEKLDLSRNQLTSLPDDLHRLKHLRILFCSFNPISTLPVALGQCTQLELAGFRGCGLQHVPSASLSPHLRGLILTDNRIAALPDEIGECVKLEKLMLSGNELTHLPEGMVGCQELQLLRLSRNQLAALPPWLLTLPKLSWFVFSDNPCAPDSRQATETARRIPWRELIPGPLLGEGASGRIFAATWQPPDSGPLGVAVKIFKGSLSSDGTSASEISAMFQAGKHPHLVEPLGLISAHPEGAQGIVMAQFDRAYRSLGNPPSLLSMTRDTYPPTARFDLAAVHTIMGGVASAAQHLHQQGLLHGDLYAHNIHWDGALHCLLGDFGAATAYGDVAAGCALADLEKLEIRALGCLLEELLARLPASDLSHPNALHLAGLRDRCLEGNVLQRPTFKEFLHQLSCNSPTLTEALAHESLQ